MADAVHADHQSPLHLGHALQIKLGVLFDRHHDRHQQEYIDRNEYREQVGATESEQQVLRGNDQIEGHDQSPVIGGLDRSQRYEFAQREE